MFNNLKGFIQRFKSTKISSFVFVLFAVFPFFLTDFILRFGVNFILLNDTKYYAVPILFDAFWIFGIVYFCYGVLPKTLGKIIYSIVYILFGVLFLANYIYFCIFGQFMWIKAVLLASEGLNYTKEALTHVNGMTVFLFVLYIIFLIITLILWKRPVYKKKYKKFLLSIIPFILLISLHAGVIVDTNIQIKNGAWEIWERPVLVYKAFTDANKSLNVCGFYQFTFKSIYRSIFDSNDYSQEDINMCEEYFENRRIKPDNKMTGLLKGKNVVFVLLESMDDWVISEKYTPTIKYMMDNGINFENHYMPNRGSGYTFNAEFAMNTGFYCPTNASSASIYTSNNFDYAMPNLFADEGYNVNSFHFNSKNFYNRKSMHTKFGYSEYYCLMNYMPIEKCVQDSEVPLTDKVYEFMTKDKFFDFFISYSAHLPYDIEDNKLKGAKEKYADLMDENLDMEINNICLLAHDTDEFFRLFIERLKEDGLYDNTVFIGVADHYAYGIKDKDKLRQYSNEAGSEIMEKVPFFIYSPSIKPVKVTKVTSAVDIVPTITNLFGCHSGYYLGNDAFDDSYKGFVYFSDGSWYDGNIHYKPSNTLVSYTPDEQEYIDELNRQIVIMSKVNDFVINSDYFK